jgi:hypothetical protein
LLTWTRNLLFGPQKGRRSHPLIAAVVVTAFRDGLFPIGIEQGQPRPKKSIVGSAARRDQ